MIHLSVEQRSNSRVDITRRRCEHARCDGERAQKPIRAIVRSTRQYKRWIDAGQDQQESHEAHLLHQNGLQ